ncbi:hypothetical protein DV737_g5245, partial [Chaetothyriales sp. CBS 132003]
MINAEAQGAQQLPGLASSAFETSSALSIDLNFGFMDTGHAPSNPDEGLRATGMSDTKIGTNSKKKESSDGGKRPAWSELKTKAGKERKRLPLACIVCRRKKIRCSGEKPACKHCLRARVPCVYKVTTRKAAPRTDYMAMLDKRLKRMEDRVIKAIPKDELPDLSQTGRASRKVEENKLFTEGLESLPSQQMQEHLAEVFFDCVYGQSYLLLHKPSFMRKLKAGTVPPVLMLAVCAISARFSTHPQVRTEPAFLRGEQWATPARKIIEKRHYEPNITILIAMLMLGLHYFGTCEGGLSWSFGGQAMRMGYALQLHRELDHDPLGRDQIVGNKNSAATSRTGPTNVTTTTSSNNDNGGDCTSSNSGNTAAKSKQTPSSQPSSSSKPSELSFTDREIRRRTMWACYLMDTFNSSGTERPSFLNEDYLQIQLPIKEENFQMEVPGPTEDLEDEMRLATTAKSNMGVAAYIIRAVVIWKRIVKYLNLGGKDGDPHRIWDPSSQFALLQRSITSLKSSLPEHLTYTQKNLDTHASLRLANQFLFLASSATTVLKSAEEITSLIAASAGHTLTVPFAGYCAYASATVHVWGMFSRNEELAASSKEALSANYRYLTRMKRYWGMFYYMAESVKETYLKFADVAMRQGGGGVGQPLSRRRRNSSEAGEADMPSNRDNGVGSPLGLSRTDSPSSPLSTDAAAGTGAAGAAESDGCKGSGSRQMFQYGDWFDKYPHGVSESEWESSHLEYRKDGGQGSQAVMSQQSDLLSVEDFITSLSRARTEEEHATDGAGHDKNKKGKATRKRRKSTVVSVSTGPGSRNKDSKAKTTKSARGGLSTTHPDPSQQSIDLTPFPNEFDLTSAGGVVSNLWTEVDLNGFSFGDPMGGGGGNGSGGIANPPPPYTGVLASPSTNEARLITVTLAWRRAAASTYELRES